MWSLPQFRVSPSFFPVPETGPSFSNGYIFDVADPLEYAFEIEKTDPYANAVPQAHPEFFTPPPPSFFEQKRFQTKFWQRYKDDLETLRYSVFHNTLQRIIFEIRFDHPAKKIIGWSFIAPALLMIGLPLHFLGSILVSSFYANDQTHNRALSKAIWSVNVFEHLTQAERESLAYELLQTNPFFLLDHFLDLGISNPRVILEIAKRLVSSTSYRTAPETYSFYREMQLTDSDCQKEWVSFLAHQNLQGLLDAQIKNQQIQIWDLNFWENLFEKNIYLCLNLDNRFFDWLDDEFKKKLALRLINEGNLPKNYFKHFKFQNEAIRHEVFEAFFYTEYNPWRYISDIEPFGISQEKRAEILRNSISVIFKRPDSYESFVSAYRLMNFTDPEIIFEFLELVIPALHYGELKIIFEKLNIHGYNNCLRVYQMYLNKNGFAFADFADTLTHRFLKDESILHTLFQIAYDELKCFRKLLRYDQLGNIHVTKSGWYLLGISKSTTDQDNNKAPSAKDIIAGLCGLKSETLWYLDNPALNKNKQISPNTFTQITKIIFDLYSYKSRDLQFSPLQLVKKIKWDAELFKNQSGMRLFRDCLEQLLFLRRCLNSGIDFSRVCSSWEGTFVGESKIKILIADLKKYVLYFVEQTFEQQKLHIKLELKNFETLMATWGDFEPVLTLIGRYNTHQDHLSLKLLARIFEVASTGDFERLKFEGDPHQVADQNVAALQLCAMTPQQKQIWRTPRVRAKALGGILVKSVSENSRFNILKDHIQITLKVHIQEALAQETDDGIKTFWLDALTRMEQSLTETDLETIATQTLKFLEETPFQNLGLNVQIQKDLGMILSSNPESLARTSENIVMTVLNHDPKMLLTVGNIVSGVSSCQNYATGSHFRSLLGYVLDANVQVILGFVLGVEHFSSPNHFKKIKTRIQSSQKTNMSFDGNQRHFVFDWTDESGKTERIQTKPLKSAQQRRILKAGQMRGLSRRVGLVLEPKFAQNHFLAKVLESETQALFQELAKDMNATQEHGTLILPASRNPHGIYSDLMHGIQTSAYDVKI